jgi:long-chain acyl-CoA synthetase
MGIFIPQLIGAEVCFRESYKPSEIHQRRKKQRINVVITVPRVLETLRRENSSTMQTSRMINSPRRKDVTFCETGGRFERYTTNSAGVFGLSLVGGATLESDTETFWRRTGYAVIQGYGMTETASLTSLSHPFRTQRGSIGKPVKGQEVKLSDDGEILVRGDNVSPGYWNGASQPLTDADGWIHTGDIGEVGLEATSTFAAAERDYRHRCWSKNLPTDLEAALDQQPE